MNEMADTDGRTEGTAHDGRFGPAGLVWRLASRSQLKLCSYCLIMTLIALLLSGVLLTMQGMAAAITKSAGRLGADLMVIPSGAEVPLDNALVGGLPMRRLLPEGVEKYLASLPGIQRAAPQYFISSAPATCCEAGNLLLIGFDPARDFTILPWLRKDSHRLTEDDALVAGGGVMKAEDARFRLYNRTFRVAARLDKSGIGYFDNALFIPMSGVAAMESASRSGAVLLPIVWGRPSLILVQLLPGADQSVTAAAIERNMPSVRVLTMKELFRAERQKMAELARVRRPLLVAGWLFALAAGGAVQIFYWRERRQTLGLLQVWGYGRIALVGLFAAEAFVLALLAMAGGSLAVRLIFGQLSSWLSRATGLPLLLETGAAVAAGIPWLCLLFAAGMAIESVVILSWLLRKEPAVLLRGA